jgi:hypothetical protein
LLLNFSLFHLFHGFLQTICLYCRPVTWRYSLFWCATPVV